MGINLITNLKKKFIKIIYYNFISIEHLLCSRNTFIKASNLGSPTFHTMKSLFPNKKLFNVKRTPIKSPTLKGRQELNLQTCLTPENRGGLCHLAAHLHQSEQTSLDRKMQNTDHQWMDQKIRLDIAIWIAIYHEHV